jgi:hypothetical protein
VRAILAQAAVSKKNWPEAYAMAVKIYNVSPQLKNIKTPYELQAKCDTRSAARSTVSSSLRTAPCLKGV